MYRIDGAFRFFPRPDWLLPSSLPQREKERSGPPNPFGYGSKRIGPNGDVGWVEYLLFNINSKPFSYSSMAFLREPTASSFRSALNEYISQARKLASEVLGLMAEGRKIEPRNVFSKLVMDEKSDEIFRLNHYPPCPLLQGLNYSLTGFGEHTDPQIISVLRSNNTQGLQIAPGDGSWASVPSDQESFFINVGDPLQQPPPLLPRRDPRHVRHPPPRVFFFSLSHASSSTALRTMTSVGYRWLR